MVTNHRLGCLKHFALNGLGSFAEINYCLLMRNYQLNAKRLAERLSPTKSADCFP